MAAIPHDINLNLLPGFRRGESPALNYSDEISWSPSGQYFVLLYTVFEVSNNNCVGSILWGSFDQGQSTVLGNFLKAGACLWSTPFVNWVSDSSFILKLQYYDGRQLHLPLVAFNMDGKLALLPRTDNLDSRPNDVTAPCVLFPLATENELLDLLVERLPKDAWNRDEIVPR